MFWWPVTITSHADESRGGRPLLLRCEAGQSWGSLRAGECGPAGAQTRDLQLSFSGEVLGFIGSAARVLGESPVHLHAGL